MFKAGRTNAQNEDQSGLPSVVSDDLIQIEKRHFKISELLHEFPHILCTVLYEIITMRLGCYKFCARWVLKMLMDGHKI
jgi:hypothetical protein